MVQIDNFPLYSVKMQSTCCKSIVKVFLALAGKGPVLWSFMSTVGKFAKYLVAVGALRISRKFQISSDLLEL